MKYWALEDELDALDRLYIKAMMEVLPDYRNYYPDANSTLRLTYGQVQGVSQLMQSLMVMLLIWKE